MNIHIKKTSLVAAIAVCFAVAILLFAVLGHDRSFHVTYIIPKDFRGHLKLRPYSVGGIESKPRSGRIVLDFTKTKTIALNGQDPMRSWCTFEAKYSDGANLPIYRNWNADYPEDLVLLFHTLGPGDNENESDIFIGTPRERMEEEFRKSGVKPKTNKELKDMKVKFYPFNGSN